jgi:hypothetical protein
MPAIKKVFPKQFSDLLNRRGLQLLAGKHIDHADHKIAVVQNIVRPEYVNSILHELDSKIFPVLKNYHNPVSDDIIKKMKKNYSEKLGKSMKMKSSELNSKNSVAYRVASDLGLVDMLNSESYKRMGEVIMGAKFGCSVGKQVICYQHGDYVSPHNDHHPEDEHLKHGYFDIQLMLSNQYVKHQWLVYEQKGFLNSMQDITSPSGIAVYRLPFWHYTTPLIGRQKKISEAKRWLLLHAFEFAG